MSSPKELVYNTTDPKVCVPEQKYLTEIARICSFSLTGRKEILHTLNVRLDSDNFYICYKSLYVLHYILTECFDPKGSPLISNAYDEFVATFFGKEHSINDKFSEKTRQMYFDYYDYFFVRLDIGHVNMKNSDIIDPDTLILLKYQNSGTKHSTDKLQLLNMDLVVLMVEVYLRLLKTILKTKVYPGITQGPNNLFFAAYKLLYNDFMLVYDILISCVKLAVEDFLDMDINQQREICGLYDEYVNITVAAVDFWALGRECGFDLKRIEPYDTTLSSTLWDYYNSPHKANNHEGITQNNATGTGSVIARKKLEAIRNMRPDIQLLMKNAGLANNPPGYDDFSNHSGLPPQQIGYQQLGGQRPVPQLPSQLPPQIAYQQFVTQQQTGYQQNITQQQTGYQQTVTQQQTGYQQAIAQQQTGYQQNFTQQQNGYQQAATQQPQSSGHQQGVSQQPQKIGNQKTGCQQPQHSGFQQPVLLEKTGNQLSVPQQQHSGYQKAVPQQHSGYQQPVQTQNSTSSPSVANFSNASKENDPIPSKPFNPFSLEHYQKEYLEEPESTQDTLKDNLVNKNPFGVEQEGIDYGQVNPKMIISQFNHLHDNNIPK